MNGNRRDDDVLQRGAGRIEDEDLLTGATARHASAHHCAEIASTSLCLSRPAVPAPHFSRSSADPRLKAFIDGVTAGAAGAILGAVFVLARRAIVDLPTLIIFAATLAALVTLKRIPEPVLIALVGVGCVVLAR